jgi:hypothetical protein
MTESDWSASTDPHRLLNFLQGKLDARRVRLFAIACCRRVWYVLDERSREAVEVVEQYADGLDRLEAWASHEMKNRVDAHHASWPLMVNLPPWWVVVTTLLSGLTQNARRLVASLVWAVAERANDGNPSLSAPPSEQLRPEKKAGAAAQEAKVQEQTVQCNLLRDIVGNPFRPVDLDRSWLTPEVLTRAKLVDDDRAFHLLPELADTLEAAGCHDADILGHCRGSGPHVSGCWVVDLSQSFKGPTEPKGDDPPWEQPRGFRLDYEPHRGPLLRAFGLVSLVTGFLSFCIVPLAIVPLAVGLSVCLIAGKDMAKMQGGRMDPTGMALVWDASGSGAGGVTTGILAILFWVTVWVVGS